MRNPGGTSWLIVQGLIQGGIIRHDEAIELESTYLHYEPWPTPYTVAGGEVVVSRDAKRSAPAPTLRSASRLTAELHRPEYNPQRVVQQVQERG